MRYVWFKCPTCDCCEATENEPAAPPFCTHCKSIGGQMPQPMLKCSNAPMMLRCIECRNEVEPGTYEGPKCPHCGSDFPPLNSMQDILIAGRHGEEVMLNWGELRTLVVWAEFWAREQHNPAFVQIMNSIQSQLRKVWPQYPLTLVDEARAQGLTEFEVRDKYGNEIIPEPTWLNSDKTVDEERAKE